MYSSTVLEHTISVQSSVLQGSCSSGGKLEIQDHIGFGSGFLKIRAHYVVELHLAQRTS